MSVEFAPRAWLHRKSGKPWEFTPSQRYGELVHVTRAGTVYAIIAGHKFGKPFWIGRLVETGAWVTWENELRATSIQFEGAGEYFFYPKTKANQ